MSDVRCVAICYLLIKQSLVLSWAWSLRSLTPDVLNITQWSPWPGQSSRAGPAMQSRVSWHQLIQCLQSLAPVSSHPLRPGAHYAGPSFPPVLCSALYICTVYYVCNGVGPRASCQWPSSVDNITQLGSVSGTRAAVTITSCQEQHRDPSRSSWWHPGHLDHQEPLWSRSEPLLPRLAAESREKVTKTV